MAFVEAIIGETSPATQRSFRPAPLGTPFFTEPATKIAALLFHFRADLLAHRAPQQVGVAERIAGHDLGDLHHLFLIDDDAERFLQDRLQHGMKIFRLLLAMLARAVGRNIRHRPRPIQRDQRDDVLETVRGACPPAPAACPDFQPGTRRPRRPAPASGSFAHRRAAAWPDRYGHCAASAVSRRHRAPSASSGRESRISPALPAPPTSC